jgi:anti-sigma factor RsiW
MDPNLTCKELIEFLADYFDGELPPAVRQEFDRHLGFCPSCVNYLESYKATIRLGKAAMCQDQDAIPCDVPEPLIQAILEARRKAAD